MPLLFYAGAIAGAAFVLSTTARKPDAYLISNPVVSESSDHYSISSCKQGYLDSRMSGDVPKAHFTVVRDLEDGQRPLLVLQRTRISAYADLHLSRNAKVPEYVSYGNAGALVYNASGKYPCPAWQWKNE
jgi:hypothetical protein